MFSFSKRTNVQKSRRDEKLNILKIRETVFKLPDGNALIYYPGTEKYEIPQEIGLSIQNNFLVVRISDSFHQPELSIPVPVHIQ